VNTAAGSVREIDVVLRRLDEIIAWAIEEESRAGYFAAMYRKVTAAVRQGIIDGQFLDGARMARFDRIFAERYIDAFEASLDDRPLSSAWRVAFEATDQRRLLILQHLLIGMNAHINLDLGIAAAAVRPAAHEAQASFRSDFDTINDVLAGLVDDFESAVGDLSPWIGLLERLGGRTDDELVKFSIEIARENAWDLVVELTDDASPSKRQHTIAHHDEVTAALGEAIRKPGRLLELALLPIRARETARVGDVIRHLG